MLATHFSDACANCGFGSHPQEVSLVPSLPEFHSKMHVWIKWENFLSKPKERVYFIWFLTCNYDIYAVTVWSCWELTENFGAGCWLQALPHRGLLQTISKEDSFALWKPLPFPVNLQLHSVPYSAHFLPHVHPLVPSSSFALYFRKVCTPSWMLISQGE